MTKKKLSKLKDVIEYESDIDIDNELFIAIEKGMQDATCALANFVQHSLNQYHWSQQLRKDFEILNQKQKVAALKLKETLKSVERTKRDAATLEKKKALRAKLYNLYKNNLGLVITPLKGGFNEEQAEIMFSFHHINKSKPDQEYSFVLVLNSQKYDVKLCAPPIEGINGLLAKLNETNDLSAFVIQIRSSFIAATS